VGQITSHAGALALALVRVDRLTKALEGGGAVTAGGATAKLRDDPAKLGRAS